MADAPLIYLSGAGGTDPDLEIPVLLQRSATEDVQAVSLGDALEQCAGQTLHVIILSLIHISEPTRP